MIVGSPGFVAKEPEFDEAVEHLSQNLDRTLDARTDERFPAK